MKALLIVMVLALGGCASSLEKRLNIVERDVDAGKDCYGPPPTWKRLARLEAFHDINWGANPNAKMLKEQQAREAENVACRKREGI